MNEIIILLCCFAWGYLGYLIEERLTTNPQFFAFYGFVFGILIVRV